ncbi:MAG: class I SAM-dependent methyltransferase [Pseudomonadales bacterium]|nr:class I SAM-dependent methyltransferase [Pseudomonadales bacterium]
MPVYLPQSLDFEARHIVLSTWIDHMPFGYDIVAAIRPRLIVELGTYSGLSFFTFCQAAQEQNVESIAYAVDTWEGDEHTGAYGEEIFSRVRDHAREHYRGFTYLLRMRFDDAVTQFDDESIELLHIDGLHTYQAVKHDFDTWYPKLAPGGILLFHDIEARLPDYGVRNLWDELEQQHETFAFRHGYGLGVLRKPGARPPSELEQLLFESNPETSERLRKLYVHLSKSHEAVRRDKRLRGELENRRQTGN